MTRTNKELGLWIEKDRASSSLRFVRWRSSTTPTRCWQPPRMTCRPRPCSRCAACRRSSALAPVCLGQATAQVGDPQAALVSFTNVARLARNASEALAASGTRVRARPPADLLRRSSKCADEAGAPHVGRHRRSDIDRFLGHGLNELRLRVGMTRQQVARQLGVSHQHGTQV
jgi:hypothetical protein